MARQCKVRRIPDREQRCRETGAWQAKRNRESVSVEGRFKTEDFRIRLKSLDPSVGTPCRTCRNSGSGRTAHLEPSSRSAISAATCRPGEHLDECNAGALSRAIQNVE